MDEYLNISPGMPTRMKILHQKDIERRSLNRLLKSGRA